MPTPFLFILAFAVTISGSVITSASAKPGNAADLYRQVMRLVDAFTEAEEELLYEVAYGLTPDTLTNEHIEFARKNDATFKLLADADAVEHCDFAMDNVKWMDDDKAWLEVGTGVRRVARLASLRSLYHLKEGRPQQAIDELIHAGNLGRRLGHTDISIHALVGVSIDALIYDQFAAMAPSLTKEDRLYMQQALKARPRATTFARMVRREHKGTIGWFREEYPKNIIHHTYKLIDGFEKLRSFMEAIIDDDSWEFDAREFHRMAAAAKYVPATYERWLDECDQWFTRAETVADLTFLDFEAKWSEAVKPVHKDNPFHGAILKLLVSPMQGMRRTLFRNRSTYAMLVAGLQYLDQGESVLKLHKEPETQKAFTLKKTATGFQLTRPLLDEDDFNSPLHFGWEPPDDADTSP